MSKSEHIPATQDKHFNGLDQQMLIVSQDVFVYVIQFMWNSSQKSSKFKAVLGKLENKNILELVLVLLRLPW